MNKECQYCKQYDGMVRLMMHSCKIHPYYDRNKNYDCRDFKWVWYLFFMKYKEKMK